MSRVDPDLFIAYRAILHKVPIPIGDIGELLKLFNKKYPSYFAFVKPTGLSEGDKPVPWGLYIAMVQVPVGYDLGLEGTGAPKIVTEAELHQMRDYVNGYVDGYRRRDDSRER